mmetsp:Transcript_12475/g.38457  ORF Transcript_12475/g.38457 Transcript_12475/m.38457 type:complete len:427 (+) Transcript_12475:1001-2281(+)
MPLAARVGRVVAEEIDDAAFHADEILHDQRPRCEASLLGAGRRVVHVEPPEPVFFRRVQNLVFFDTPAQRVVQVQPRVFSRILERDAPGARRDVVRDDAQRPLVARLDRREDGGRVGPVDAREVDVLAQARRAQVEPRRRAARRRDRPEAHLGVRRARERVAVRLLGARGVAGPRDVDLEHARLVHGLVRHRLAAGRQPEAVVAVHLLRRDQVRRAVGDAGDAARAVREPPRRAAARVDGADLVVPDERDRRAVVADLRVEDRARADVRERGGVEEPFRRAVDAVLHEDRAVRRHEERVGLGSPGVRRHARRHDARALAAHLLLLAQRLAGLARRERELRRAGRHVRRVELRGERPVGAREVREPLAAGRELGHGDALRARPRQLGDVREREALGGGRLRLERLRRGLGRGGERGRRLQQRRGRHG